MREKRAQEAVLTDYANSLIRFKAHQLSRRAGFSHSDEDDLKQELRLALLSKADCFDAKRASIDTFVDRVINSAVRMILRDRRRQKRANGFHAQSLDAPIGEQNGDATSLGSSLSDADRIRHRGCCPADDSQRREDREAIEHALGEMSKDSHDVCRRVMGGSISSAARERGTSRRQIRNGLADAQPYVERAGFGDA